MQASDMTLEPRASSAQRYPESVEELIAGQQHIARQPTSEYEIAPQGHDSSMMDVYPSTETSSAHDSLSPTKQVQPKHVSFELLLPQSPQHRARLPMRVNIYPHDTTDSIITTVKNFYGLYERKGVIFEDRHGTILIARFENFEHGMVVYVRVSAEDPDVEDYSPDPRQPTVSPRRPRPHLDEAFQMLPPVIYNQGGARADLRNERRTHSPQPRGRRSASASTHARRNRQSAKSRGNSMHGSFAEENGDVYSDSDGGDGSVTSSRRSKKEPLASADISVDNIVEGGRRKRAKFDSSVSNFDDEAGYSRSNSGVFSGAAFVRTSSGSDDRLAIVRLSSTSRQRKHGRIALLHEQPADVLLPASSALASKLWADGQLVYARTGHTILCVKRFCAGSKVTQPWFWSIWPVSVLWQQRSPPNS